ncbi:MAG: helix-turn-helix domain-containing protein [Planctomycetaceae bacterium]|nr:MAG: helix-turn-helix domain-containing protein [Planctomycetaceae bacterium]
MVPARFHDWREWRRMRAMELDRQGWPQREIAAALGASPGSVSEWLHAARQEGPAALRSRPPTGRRPS